MSVAGPTVRIDGRLDGQNRSAEENNGRRIALGDVFDGFSASGNNFFAVKATFWMPVK